MIGPDFSGTTTRAAMWLDASMRANVDGAENFHVNLFGNTMKMLKYTIIILLPEDIRKNAAMSVSVYASNEKTAIDAGLESASTSWADMEGNVPDKADFRPLAVIPGHHSVWCPRL